MRASRGGFTLPEVMLAAILGAMVVLACVGMFAAIDRQAILGRGRFDETLELGQTHAAVERAMQLLLMSDTAPPVVPTNNPRRPRDGAAPEAPDPALAEELAPPEPVRLSLSFDGGLSGSMTLHDGRSIPPQRVEVTLRSPPIYVPQEAISADQAAETRRERRRREEEEAERLAQLERANRAESADGTDRAEGENGTDGTDGTDGADPAEEETEAAPQLADITIAPGLRGVFELVPELPAADINSTDVEPEPTWALWWRQIGIEETVGGTEWPEGMAPGRLRLASDLVRCHWQVYRGGKWLDEWDATWPDDLPAYVRLEVLTVRGTYHEWLFEVGWNVGKDPGTMTSTPVPQDEGAAQPTGDQRPSGEQRPDAPPAPPASPLRPEGRR